MKNVTDKLLHEMESIETRISRLEDETCKLDRYVENVKDSEERYHGTTYGKLSQMHSVLQEVLVSNIPYSYLVRKTIVNEHIGNLKKVVVYSAR